MKVLLTLTDVEPAVRLNAKLEAHGVDTQLVSPMDDIRGAIAKFKPDVVVLTGALLDPSNVALVKQLHWDDTAVVGLAEVSDGATLERLRAFGLTEVYAKPIGEDELFDRVRRVLDRQRLHRLTGLIGESEAIREVLVRVEQMAPVSSTVLIEGESGTGKELVARAIHRLSLRRNGPFIPVNVGALPETLLESELFGHEKGAFTGAAERRLGRFELADRGTLFLDEIGEIPQSTQVKLLRVLEEREVTRVGGTQPFRVDVRIVAATNRPLREHVGEGQFRADLYYRLNVLRIYLPPLRERREDIPHLIRQMIRQLSKEHDRPFHGISAEAMALLAEYDWPGNVRELRNLVESMVVLAPGREIEARDIPHPVRDGAGGGGVRLLPVHVGAALVQAREEAMGLGGGRELEFIVRSLVELKLQMEQLRQRVDQERIGIAAPGWIGELPVVESARVAVAGGGSGAVASRLEPRDDSAPPNVVTVTPGMTMAEIERAAIEAALRETHGNRRKAAELLGIGERTLYRKLQEYEAADAPASVEARADRRGIH